jgi:hypothetical protein
VSSIREGEFEVGEIDKIEVEFEEGFWIHNAKLYILRNIFI